jgi:hypothetical protein
MCLIFIVQQHLQSTTALVLILLHNSYCCNPAALFLNALSQISIVVSNVLIHVFQYTTWGQLFDLLCKSSHILLGLKTCYHNDNYCYQLKFFSHQDPGTQVPGLTVRAQTLSRCFRGQYSGAASALACSHLMSVS